MDGNTRPLEDNIDIAIVGMSGQFPGAHNVDEFWNNLKDGVESISFFSDEELLQSGVDPALIKNPNYVKAAPILENPGHFDAAFFGYSPREARSMDPQHRLFLECAWQALEHAGYFAETYNGKVGVYGGAAMNSYLLFSGLLPNFATDYLPTLIGNDNSFLATRVSYKLNLTGPSVTVQTACSSSLVAVHMACQSLLNEECDMAMAGGVSLRVPHKIGHLYQDGSVFTPDGHCRPFDAKAQGTIFGSGVGVIVLKRLEDAIADGDHIHAVIKGTAINNDGSSKADYTAPGVNSQAEVVIEALANANVDAKTISYVEAHGTGTYLGDPIEVTALTKAFRTYTDRSSYCALGSVKSNIGHMDAAAGIAGLIKTVLALEHKKLPPTLHYDEPNPEIDFQRSPFYVQSTLADWPDCSHPRRAGISSLGIGGTNAHAILEEAPVIKPSSESRPWQLLTLSALSETALDQATQNLADDLEANPELILPDVAYTQHAGRKPMDVRRVLVCQDRHEAAEALRSEGHQQVFTPSRPAINRSAAFLFPGQGSQYVNMGQGLFQTEPVFRQAIDDCAHLLQPHLDLDVRNILYPSKNESESAERQLTQTWLTQPTLFAVEYATARMWMSWGITPKALVGHSIGEYVAACLAGIFELEDALSLVAARGRIMQDLPTGSMLAAMCSAEEIQRYLRGSLSLAAVNGSNLCVASGESEDVDALQRQLEISDVECRRLRTSHAFHSAMMDPIVKSFASRVAQVKLREPRIPVISNVSGSWMKAAEATDPDYWARHLRHTVRFFDGLTQLFDDPTCLLLEVGPGSTLSSLARQHPNRSPEHVVLSSIRHPREQRSDAEFIARTLGRLWASGLSIDWSAYHANEERRRVPLSTYPFQREHYWFDSGSSGLTTQVAPTQKTDMPSWFYVPSWIRTAHVKPSGAAAENRPENWLVFLDHHGIGRQMTDRLEAQGHEVTTVTIGERFGKENVRSFKINPGSRDDYAALFSALASSQTIPRQIAHLWNITGQNDTFGALSKFDELQQLGFESLIYLTQALSQTNVTDQVQIGVVSNQLHEVTGDEILNPEKATLLGPCKVIRQEFPNITCRSIDVVFCDSNDSQKTETLINQLCAEFSGLTDEPVVAYRGHHRWAQTFEPIMPENGPLTKYLREGGVYLITGGLGRVGYTLAEHLAKNFRARLVLTGRSKLPSREQWSQWLESHGEEDATCRRIRKVKSLEAAGADVLACTADVSNEAQMRGVLAQVDEHFGDLHGVIHAAGLVDEHSFNSIINCTRATSARHFRPKVAGVYALDRVLRNESLDFCLLMSSISTVLGGIGYSDYAAANHFMDLFATNRNICGTTRWLSVNWDIWRFDDNQPTTDNIGATLSGLGIFPEEGFEALRRVLATPSAAGQVVVSTADLKARIVQWVTPSHSTSTKDQSHSTPSNPDSRPGLASRGNSIEQTITNIWIELLGVDHVSSDDNFTELGGHSLLATQMISRLQRDVQVALSIRDVLDNPTIAELAKVIEHKKGQIETSLPSEADQSDDNPLSSAQSRVWFLNQLHPDNASDNLPLAYRLSGQLNATALQQSLETIVRRHNSLRTTFTAVDGRPLQVIHSTAEVGLNRVDLTDIDESLRDDEVRRLATVESRKLFDLSKGPLWRITLFSLSAEDHVLLFNMHHIISDGWSYGVLFRELSELYEAFTSERCPSLADMRMQYADYARSQQRWLQSPDVRDQRKYWERQLSGELPQLDVHTDRPRPAIQTFDGAKQSLTVRRDLYEQLKSLGRSEGCTVFMVLLTALYALLNRYSGQNDLIVGSPVANRNRPESEGLIGLFLNMLALRVSLDGNTSVRDVLRRVRETTLDAYANQDLPFDAVIERLPLERDMSRNPLFQVMLQVSPENVLNLSGLTVKRFEFDSQTAQFDLAFHLWESKFGLKGHVEYSTALFETSTIDRMACHLQQLLAAMVTDPDKPIGALPILSSSEHQQLVVDWNDTETNDDIESTVHALFQSQALNRQEATALVCDGQTLSYRELNRRANQLALYLRRRGVGPGVLVAICVERSMEMMIGLLGILKAGGAYVPLDPAFPSDRLAYMMEDTRSPLVVTQKRLQGVSFVHSSDVIHLDTDWHSIVSEVGDGNENPSNLSSPDDLAYVIYTSGSTGQPKGVEIPHRAAINFLLSMGKRPGMTERDCLLAVTTLSFDIALLELFLPLCFGAKTVIASGEEAVDGRRLVSMLNRSGITVMQATPATWRMLLDAGWSGNKQLKVLCGGEPLPKDLAASLLPRCGSLWNMYGPTETTVWSSVAEVESAEATITIGRPIANTEMYILNENLQPVPVGVPGVLYIGGAGLARGYLHRQSLTIERFISHPFRSAGRLYNTGDLARYLPENQSIVAGSIEHLGRIDNQVKVRGFRIELGEIEAILSRHPAVDQAVVAVRDDGHDNRLVAYLVYKQTTAPTVGELRAFLQNSLPAYMIPSAFVTLAALPMTLNNKVDRRALPAPDSERPELDDEFVRPRNGVETQLVEIWEKVLDTRPIGVRDNFFELGGSSLRAVRMFSRLEKVYGKKLPLTTLFQSPTIEQLAELLHDREDWSASWDSLVAIQPNGTRPPLFCVHAAGGHVLLYRNLARHLGSDQPVYGLQSKGLDGQTSPLLSVEEMATHYVREIQSLQPEGPYLLGGYCLGGTIALEMAQQLHSMGQRVALLALFETYNWAKLPPLSLWQKIFVNTQKVEFHLRNLIIAGGPQRRLFVKDKLAELKRRGRMWIESFPLLFRHAASSQVNEKKTISKLWSINDEAARRYQAKPYDGRISHFRPRKEFRIVNVLPLGWDELAMGGVDSHKIPVYPAGMLMEPFVRILANQLNHCIEESLSQPWAPETPVGVANISL